MRRRTRPDARPHDTARRLPAHDDSLVTTRETLASWNFPHGETQPHHDPAGTEARRAGRAAAPGVGSPPTARSPHHVGGRVAGPPRKGAHAGAARGAYPDAAATA